jgi:cytochrome c oxidase subunit 4
MHPAGPTLATYIAVFVALLVLLGATVVVAFVDVEALLPQGAAELARAAVALVIALVKAVLVALFFMHVRYERRLVWLVAGGAVVWLGILLGQTFSDYLTRGAGFGMRIAPASVLELPTAGERPGDEPPSGESSGL